jgi:hypothetical protein
MSASFTLPYKNGLLVMCGVTVFLNQLNSSFQFVYGSFGDAEGAD